MVIGRWEVVVVSCIRPLAVLRCIGARAEQSVSQFLRVMNVKLNHLTPWGLVSGLINYSAKHKIFNFAHARKRATISDLKEY